MRGFRIVGILLALSGSVTSSQVQPFQAQSDSTGLWFVEFASPPTADGGSLSAVRADHAAFRRRAAAASIRFEERVAFEALFNGLSIRTSRASANRIANLDGVRAVWPVLRIESPQPRQEDSADLFTALAMTGADVAQNTLGYTGAGVRVGVIDTGVDYHHPDLGGCFGEGCRVVIGWDFVGDDFQPECDGRIASRRPSKRGVPAGTTPRRRSRRLRRTRHACVRHRGRQRGGQGRRA